LAAAAADLRAAQAALTDARNRIDDARAAGNEISRARSVAADLLTARMSHAAEIGVAKHSWLDRIRSDFTSSGIFRWVVHGGAESVIANGVDRVMHGSLGILKSATREIKSLSDRFGFVEPLLVHVPMLGRIVDIASDGDQYARLEQNLFDGHYQAAFDEGSGILSSAVTTTPTPITALVAANVVVWSDAEDAERGVNWSEAFEHPSQLNPLQPGGLTAIWSAEKTGMAKLGGQAIGLVAGLF
jgi:hypothetical protein